MERLGPEEPSLPVVQRISVFEIVEPT